MNRAQRRANFKKHKRTKFKSIEDARKFLKEQRITAFNRKGVFLPLEQATEQEVVDALFHNFGAFVYVPKMKPATRITGDE